MRDIHENLKECIERETRTSGPVKQPLVQILIDKDEVPADPKLTKFQSVEPVMTKENKELKDIQDAMKNSVAGRRGSINQSIIHDQSFLMTSTVNSRVKEYTNAIFKQLAIDKTGL